MLLTAVCTTDWHLGLDAGTPFTTASESLARRHPEHERMIRAYVDNWQHMFAGEFAATVHELREFAAAGYRVHALSNYPGEQIRFLYERFEFMQLFDTVVISGLLGFTKPDRRIYDYLLDVIEAPTCLFIDDRVENVRSAESLGIKGLHYDLVSGPARLAEFRARNGIEPHCMESVS